MPWQSHILTDQLVNPFSTRRSRLCPPDHYWHPQIIRPSYGPGLRLQLFLFPDPSFTYSWSISLSIRPYCRTIVQSLASRNFNDPSLNFLYQNRQPGTAKNMGYRDLFLAPILSCVRSPWSNQHILKEEKSGRILA